MKPVSKSGTLLAAAFVFGPVAAAADCTEYTAFTQAVQTDDYDTAVRLYEDLDINPSCSDRLRDWGASYLARTTFMQAVTGDVAPAQKEALLRQALSYEEHWRSYAELGHLAWKQEDYTKAAQNFQSAINRLVDGPEEHSASTVEIEEIYQLATASVGLASEPVEVPKTRSGAPGGIFAGSIRGFVVEEVSLPVTYLFDETEFDAPGKVFAEKLAQHLKDIEARKVTLAGHTDPQGSDEYNMALSVKRAEALGRYLGENGYEGEIETIGYGESRPPNVLPGIDPESETFFRLSRRVMFETG